MSTRLRYGRRGVTTYALDLVEGNFVLAAVVQLCSAWRHVRGYLTLMLTLENLLIFLDLSELFGEIKSQL